MLLCQVVLCQALHIIQHLLLTSSDKNNSLATFPLVYYKPCLWINTQATICHQEVGPTLPSHSTFEWILGSTTGPLCWTPGRTSITCPWQDWQRGPLSTISEVCCKTVLHQGNPHAPCNCISGLLLLVTDHSVTCSDQNQFETKRWLTGPKMICL